ncbi:MAG: hypothetical protein RLZZ292_514 [Bacteroidota bacterium]|jgi:hypothetical protein
MNLFLFHEFSMHKNSINLKKNNFFLQNICKLVESVVTFGTNHVTNPRAMKFSLYPLKRLIVVAAFLVPIFGWSQGTMYYNYQLLVGDTLHNLISGVTQGPFLSNAPKHGTLTLTGSTVQYLPSATFVGVDTFAVNYKTTSGGISQFYSKGYIVRVDNAFITTGKDYAATTVNTPVTIDVLANDQVYNAQGTTGGAAGLELDDISLLNNGTAQVVNGKVKFTPNPGFEGNAYVNYLVIDFATGKAASGSVAIAVSQAILPATTTLNLTTLKGTPITALLPANGFQVMQTAANGTLSTVNGNTIIYTPNSNFVGNEVFRLQRNQNGNSSELLVSIEVLSKPSSNLYAVDDEAFTPVNQATEIEVLRNDKGSNFAVSLVAPCAASKGQVTYLGNGKFSFVPANNFVGLAKFTYKISLSGLYGTIDETATVKVFVTNLMPALQTFNLTTTVDKPLVLNYNIPIVGYNFAVVDQALHGTVTYSPNPITIAVGNQIISGSNLVVYTPNNNYVGADNFQLNYCINGVCRSVKCNVEVKDIQASNTCVGGECVWAGDTNNDGQVDMSDLLPIGFCVGENGTNRAAASTAWYGQMANGWQSSFGAVGNLKYIDTNGNGNIEASDTTAISNNYNLTHNIVAAMPQNLKALPIYLTLLTPNPQIGDLVEVEVNLGKSIDPAFDVHGFTFSYNYSTQIINAASLQVEFNNNSWMTYNTPSLRMAKKPFDGRVDVGYVRTGGTSASGYGRVAKMKFVVEDEIDGIKDDGQQKSLHFSGNTATMMDATGETFALQVEDLIIPIQRKASNAAINTPINEAQVLTYPNPVNDIVHIYLNGGYEATTVSIYSSTGQLVQSTPASGKTIELNVSDLNAGMYLLKVVTNNGTVVKKMVK